MRAKNVTTRPLDIEEGRSVPAGEFGDVNSRDPVVAAHIEAGRLVARRRRPPRQSEPVNEESAAADQEGDQR